MSLPNDISRCGGENLSGQKCEKRETCRRFLDVSEGYRSYWWLGRPQIPGPCEFHWPTEAPKAPLSEAKGSESKSEIDDHQ